MGRLRALLQGSEPRALGITALGLLAGLLLIATLFLTITSVAVANGSCEVINDANPDLADRCSLSGFERRGPAFALLGLLCLAMAVGAGVGASRPAAFALVALGVIVLVITVASDIPESAKTGAIGRNFEGAKAVKGPGLYLELLAGALAVGAGLLRLLNRRGEE
jgi:O-antigen ligase